MNAGLRYETESPFTERYNSINSSIAICRRPRAIASFPTCAAAWFSPAPMRATVWQWDRLNFAPRLGFAWSAAPKTVIRWGAGFFYAPAETSNAATAFAATRAIPPPLLIWLRSTVGSLLPGPSATPTPWAGSAGAQHARRVHLPGQNVPVWDDKQVMPVTYQWNFDLQRELPGQLVDAAYVGSRGVHLAFKNRQINELDPQYLVLGLPSISRCPIPSSAPLPCQHSLAAHRHAPPTPVPYLPIYRRQLH